MAREQNKLTAKAVEAATFEGKAYKLFDGGGLFLHVQQAGKYWRLKYRFRGRENTLGLGPYPQVKLAGAREARDEAKRKIAKGIDPSAERKAEKAAQAQSAESTFEAVAREWWEAVHRHKVSASHAQKNLRRLENHAFPILARRPIAEITPAEVLDALRRLEDKDQVENAHRLKTLIGQVFRYAIPTGRTERDVTADLKDALRSADPQHQPALTTPEEVAPLLQAIEGYSGQPTTVAALKLTPMLFTRPGELRKAAWADFDLEAGTWDYKPSKGGAPLLTPLPRQALAILRELEPVTGLEEYVFPANRGRGRPLSENTINAALKSMGYGGKMVAHGFRAMARTILVERLGYPVEVVEMQLGHAVRDVHGRAYNRATFFEQRQEMLQTWADYLDQLRDGGDVVPLNPQSAG